MLDETLKNISFDLKSGLCSSKTGLARKGSGFEMGSCLPSDEESVITISIEILIPLLRTDLTQAERRLDHIRIAITVLHELCVSVSAVQTTKQAIL
jgi:hypothetical protein